ncbi:MAG: YicC family protein [Lentisphaerae bacterium]|nr:YicC family protein [Lentisphaerota bacterium]
MKSDTTVRSMTGRGAGAAADAWARVEAELSSVNRKSLDVAVQLPRFLAAHEGLLHQHIQRALTRGRVTGEVRVTWTRRARATAIQLDESLARAGVEALRATARILKLPDDLTASSLLELPDVLRVEQPAADIARLEPLLRKALDAALRDLQTMRRREGVALARDLRRRMTGLGAIVTRIQARAPRVTEAYRGALLERLARVLPGKTQPDDERILKEIALFADRSDITEELVRLRSHLAQARELLRNGGVIGRSLDFLAQEMMREINTLSAKANDGGITRETIAFKAELERAREQIQNIE